MDWKENERTKAHSATLRRLHKCNCGNFRLNANLWDDGTISADVTRVEGSYINAYAALDRPPEGATDDEALDLAKEGAVWLTAVLTLGLAAARHPNEPTRPVPA